jgi:hypothetical protein
MATTTKIVAGDGSDDRYFAELVAGEWQIRVPDPWKQSTTYATSRGTEAQAAQIIDGAQAQAMGAIEAEASGKNAYRDLLAQHGFTVPTP